MGRGGYMAELVQATDRELIERLVESLRDEHATATQRPGSFPGCSVCLLIEEAERRAAEHEEAE